MPPSSAAPPVAAPAAATRRARRIAAWAGLGVALLLGEAALRMLGRFARWASGGPSLAASDVALIAGVAALFAWGEGYRALQRRFAPYVVARALGTGAHVRGCLPVLGAPLRAMALYGAPRREVARAWAGVLAIGLAIAAVRQLPALLRAAVDLGVGVALLWGAVAVGVRLGQALRLGHVPWPPGRPGR